MFRLQRDEAVREAEEALRLSKEKAERNTELIELQVQNLLSIHATLGRIDNNHPTNVSVLTSPPLPSARSRNPPLHTDTLASCQFSSPSFVCVCVCGRRLSLSSSALL